MILVKSGGHTVYDPRSPVLKLTDPRLTLEDSSAGSLTFKIYESNPNCGSIRKLYPPVEVVRDGKVIFKGRVITDRRDFYNGRSVEVEGKMAFFNDSYLEPFSFQGSPEELFRMIVENHNAQVMPWQQFRTGIVTVRDSNGYIVRSSENIMNSWNALKEKCFKSSLGGHVRIRHEEDGDYVDWLEDYTKISSQSIRFAENMIDMSVETDASATWTAIRPVGADADGVRTDISSVNGGKTYLINRAEAEKYGIIFAPEEESVWEDVTLPENLMKKAEEKLYGSGAALNETYEIRAVDLNLTDGEIEALDICEYVPVESRPHGISGNYLLTKADISIASPQNSVYCLGVSRRVFSDMNSGSGGTGESVPRRISALENDAGYISEEKAGEMLSEYTKTEEVKSIVSGAVADIPAGKDGKDGENGRDGESAYETALRNGFSGTEEEWLDSLRGSPGESGAPGRAATVRIGRVTTGAPGTEAAVENAGTEEDAVLNFTIPRGERGSPGSSGGSGGSGLYVFEIRADGHLWLVSETEADGDRFYVSASGHLIYRMEG